MQAVPSYGLKDKLKKRILEIAEILKNAKENNARILLRFHNDADGISGALALDSVLRLGAIQQNSAIYTTEQAMNDINELYQQKKAIVILLDFGSNKESSSAVSLLTDNNVEAIVIDHHPMETESNAITLNPYCYCSEGVSSTYTAGYIACELADVLGGKTKRLARAACAGDRSQIIKISEKDREMALVLDYVSANPSLDHSVKFYKKIIDDKELYYFFLREAKEQWKEISIKMKMQAKALNSANFSIYSIDMKSVHEEYKNIAAGRLLTYFFEQVTKKDTVVRDNAVIVIGNTNRSIMLRLNQNAVERGLDSEKIIKKIKLSMSDFIEAGGGHAKAAAIRVKKGFVKSVLDEIMKIILAALVPS